MDIDVRHIQSAKVGPFGNFGAPIGPLDVLDIDVSHIQSAKVGKFGAPIGPLDVLDIDVQCVVKRWSPHGSFPRSVKLSKNTNSH